MQSAPRAVALVTLAVVLIGLAGAVLTPARGAAASPGNAAASPPPVTVLLDGLPVTFDVPPMILGGRTLVPFRLLSEALGAEVQWDEETGRVHATLELDDEGRLPARTVDLWVGQTRALASGRPCELDVPATLVEGRTLVPLRFFGEALGAAVTWDPATRTVHVTSPRRPMEVLGYYALGTAETSSWTELFGRPHPESAVGLADVVSEIACAWFVLDATTGGIVLDDSYSAQKRPANWEDVLARCRAYGQAADMMVHWARRAPDGSTDASIYSFLADPLAMRRVVEEITGYAQDFSGVNLDIELLGARQTPSEIAVTRERFTSFVRLLAESLRASGKTLTLSLHPLNSWYPGYDWQALGELADRIVIMAYGYSPKGTPEPLDKVTQAVDLALEVVPRHKLLLGLLPVSETPETLRLKVGLAKQRRLAGVALWRLGVIGPERRAALRSLLAREPAAAVVVAGGTAPLDLAASPPLVLAGRVWVPLFPVLGALGLEASWDRISGWVTLDLGSGPEGPALLSVAGSDAVHLGDGSGQPGEAQAVVVGEWCYVPADVLCSLVGRYVPEPDGRAPAALWDEGRLLLLLTPGA
ncbi:MAG: copper amine oxidase [Firmicutes bacterium]|nr:copper amine oxidase [Bacillota bacterium]